MLLYLCCSLGCFNQHWCVETRQWECAGCIVRPTKAFLPSGYQTKGNFSLLQSVCKAALYPESLMVTNCIVLVQLHLIITMEKADVNWKFLTD